MIDYSDLVAGVLGGLLGSLITALVSLYILRKQFLREEKTVRESRASEIMQRIERSIWTIINGLIYESVLIDKFNKEFYQLPGYDAGGASARSDLFIRISEEEMRSMVRTQDAERELIQQRALIELFIGQDGALAFDEVSKKIPELKEALTKINKKDKTIRNLKPEDASNWKDYNEALSKLRKVLWDYAKCDSWALWFKIF